MVSFEISLTPRILLPPMSAVAVYMPPFGNSLPEFLRKSKGIGVCDLHCEQAQYFRHAVLPVDSSKIPLGPLLSARYHSDPAS
jgi:hypothetical protein